MTDAAHDALDGYVRATFMERQALLINALKTERQQDVAIKGAMQQAASLHWMSGIGMQIITGGFEGFIRILFEGCRINEPTLEWFAFKQDILAAHATQAEAVRTARAAFEATNPKVQRAETTTTPPKEKQSHSQKRKSTRS